MRGIPLRVEIGPKDMEQNQAVLVRRDTHEKTVVCLDELEQRPANCLKPFRRICWKRPELTERLIPILLQNGMSLWIPLTISQVL